MQDAISDFPKTKFGLSNGSTYSTSALGTFNDGGGGFSAKFRAGVCRPQFQNGTVG